MRKHYFDLHFQTPKTFAEPDRFARVNHAELKFYAPDETLGAMKHFLF